MASILFSNSTLLISAEWVKVHRCAAATAQTAWRTWLHDLAITRDLGSSVAMFVTVIGHDGAQSANHRHVPELDMYLHHTTK